MTGRCGCQAVLGLFEKAHDGSDASAWSRLACSLRLGRFGIVTPHNPPLSLGFLATQGKPGRAVPVLGFALRSSPSEGRRGSDASFLPSDSGQIRPGCARPGLCPSLRSIRAVRNGSDASAWSRLACSRRPVSLRLGTAIAGFARLSWLFLASVQPGCSQRLGRFGSHRVPPPAGGGIKSKPRVFRGHAPRKTLCSWKIG